MNNSLKPMIANYKGPQAKRSPFMATRPQMRVARGPQSTIALVLFAAVAGFFVVMCVAQVLSHLS